MAQQQKQKQVIKYIYVKEFLTNEKGSAIGVKGIAWPDRSPVAVIMDNDCEKAKNARRRTFSEWARGFKYQDRTMKLEPGSMIRLRCTPCEPLADGVQSFKTDWINVITRNGEETRNNIKMGLIQCKIRTPADVKNKRNEIRESAEFKQTVKAYKEKNGRDMPPEMYNREVENRLAEAMRGRDRYQTVYYNYRPDGCMKGSDPTALREELINYFSDSQFNPQYTRDDMPYRPVKPHLIVRGLNEQGQYNGIRAEFMPGHDMRYKRDENGKVIDKACLTAEECAEAVIANLPTGCAGWNILPAYVYTHSLEQMKIGSGNDYSLRQVYALNADCHLPDADGGRPQMRAINMALRVSSGEKCVVTEVMRDFRAQAVDPVLIDHIKISTTPGEMDEVVLLAVDPALTSKMNASGAKDEAKPVEPAHLHEEEEESSNSPS